MFTDLDHDPSNKVIKNSIKLKKIQSFSDFFCLLMEGSETWAGSGAVQIHTGTDRDTGGPRTYRSGSGTQLTFYDLYPQLEMHFIRIILLIPNQENIKGKQTKNALVSLC